MAESNKCTVYGSAAHALAQLCKRCKNFRDRVETRGKPDLAARVEALRRAWDGTGFRCYYSGVRLEETNSHDPRYLTFDHRTPRHENDLVVAAAFVNDMKSDMSEDEFRAVIVQLASRFQGGAFDERVLKLVHWKR